MKKRRGQGGEGPGETGRRSPARRFSIPFVAAICAAAICSSSCGIESSVYYSPPSFAYAGNLLTLQHNSDNTDFFLGYDVYYRAYYSLSEATAARSAIESATNSTSYTPDSVLSLLVSKGFKKMCLATAPTVTQTPLLPKGPSTFYIYLPSTSSSTDWYYVTNSSATQIGLVRNTGYGDHFNSPYLVGANDYGSTASGVSSGQTVYIDAFALAYGYDFSKLSSIYSYPASLYEPIGGSNGYTLP